MHAGHALLLFGLALTHGPALAEPGSVDAPQAEIARLRARIAELEAENARLRGESAAGITAALEAAAEGTVEVRFDERRDTTTIALTPSRIVRSGGDETRHWLALRADHPGRVPAAPFENVALVVQTAASGGEYRDAGALHLTVDGGRSDCAVVGYVTEPITAGRTAGHVAQRETVTVALPAALLARIGTAREVRGSLGPTDFQLTPAQLSGFRAFRRRLDDAPTP